MKKTVHIIGQIKLRLDDLCHAPGRIEPKPASPVEIQRKENQDEHQSLYHA
jgi:hypothetical protein